MSICDIFRRKKWFTVHGVLCFDDYGKYEGEGERPMSVSLCARTWKSAVNRVQKSWYREAFVRRGRWFEPTKVINHTERQTTTLSRRYRYYD